jgi:hypothetical protein
MKKMFSIFVGLIAVFVSGCQTTAPIANKTSLDIQSIQAKMFESDKPTAFKSVLSVLQDLGYVVQAASLETGVITAQSPTKRTASFAAVFGVRTEGRTYVTATVEDFNPKQSRIRLNFVDKQFRSGAYGQVATDEKPVEDVTIYQNAFEKIGEAIFIRAAQK